MSLEPTEDLLNLILSKCPLLQVLVLPWYSFKESGAEAYIHKLLTERKLKLFCESTMHVAACYRMILQVKKYERYYSPLKERVLGDYYEDSVQHFHSTGRAHPSIQKFVYLDRDIFGVKLYF